MTESGAAAQPALPLPFVLSPEQMVAYTGKYEGERNAAGEAEGYGKERYADGEEYVGEWRSGLMEGDGTYLWPDGESYEGEWRGGKRYGEGIATYAPGRNAAPFYDGNWEFDEPVEDYPLSVHAGH